MQKRQSRPIPPPSLCYYPHRGCPYYKLAKTLLEFLLYMSFREAWRIRESEKTFTEFVIRTLLFAISDSLRSFLWFSITSWCHRLAPHSVAPAAPLWGYA